jgi:hypothetical protein
MTKYTLAIVFEDGGEASISERINVHDVYAYTEGDAIKSLTDYYEMILGFSPTISGIIFLTSPETPKET